MTSFAVEEHLRPAPEWRRDGEHRRKISSTLAGSAFQIMKNGRPGAC